MHPAILVGIVVVLVGIAVAVGFYLRKTLVRAALQLTGVAQVGGFPVRYFYLAGSTQDWFLRQAMELALAHLAKVWPPQELFRMLDGIFIAVAPAPWRDETGATVAGQAFPSTLSVSVESRLEALAHELAHVVEAGPGRRAANHEHIDWDKQGIFEACAAFQAELRGVRE